MRRGLITGASRGIGRAIALEVAGSGGELLLQGRNERALGDVCAAVEARGGRATPLVADLGDPAAVEALCAVGGAAPLDFLVNNAGEALVKPVEGIGLDEWQRGLAVGVTAPFLLVRGLLGNMPAGATIVTVLSVAARQAFPGWAAYCAVKFALDGFTRALREEVRGRGVRVINVYPAATATGLWDGVPGEWTRERMLAADDVARAVVYALSQPSSVMVDELHLGHIAGNQ